MYAAKRAKSLPYFTTINPLLAQWDAECGYVGPKGLPTWLAGQ